MKRLYTFLTLLLLFNAADSYATGYFKRSLVGKVLIGDTACGTRINCAIRVEKGNILFAGHSDCNAQGDIPATTALQLGSNIVVGKLDSNYKILWVKVFGGDDTLMEQAKALCRTKDGGYAIVSTTSSTNGSITVSNGKDDIWLLKLDANGNQVFEKNIGSTGDDRAISITEDTAGNLLILGASNGADGDIPSHYGTAAENDWVLIKTNAAGAITWVKTIGGTGDEGNEGSILANNTHYFIASGSNSVDNDCSDTSWFDTAKTGYNYHLLKLDTAGAVLWDKSYGGSDTDMATGAIFDYDGGILLTGYSMSSDSMVNDNTPTFKTAWLVKATDTAGNMIYTKSINKMVAEPAYANGVALCKAFETFSPSPNPLVMASGMGKTAEDVLMCYLEPNTWQQNLYTKYEFDVQQDDWVASLFGVGDRLYAVAGSTVKTDTAQTADHRLLNRGDKGFISIVNYGWYGSVNDIATGRLEMKAYPNPASGYVTIELPAGNTAGRLEVVNTLGQQVYAAGTSATEKTKTITTSSLPAGMYHARFTDAEGGVAYSDFVVQ